MNDGRLIFVLEIPPLVPIGPAGRSLQLNVDATAMAQAPAAQRERVQRRLAAIPAADAAGYSYWLFSHLF
jgi:hypothetical protein